MNKEYNMWKELSEVPQLIRYNIDNFKANCTLDFNIIKPDKISHIKLIASGSSNNAAYAGRFILEDITNIPVSVEYASEFAHHKRALNKNTLVIGISQSGKTADTLSALEKVKQDKTCKILSITNVKYSPIYNIADANILLGAGEEKAIPATKTFSMQLLAIFNLALLLANELLIYKGIIKKLNEELYNLPELIETVINKHEEIKLLTESLINKEHLVILSHGINYYIGREGALKLKESCYIDANSYPIGEFMHGYMAMLDSNYRVLILDNGSDDFIQTHTQQLKEKCNAKFYAITMKLDNTSIYDSYITLPQAKTALVSSFIFTTCLQIMAFYGGVYLGYNPDKPRNLSKYLENEV